MALDLTGIPAFLAIAESGSFRAAADRLGVTRSAVSQSLRALETRLDTRLVSRTTRSVALTEAGRELHARIAPAISEVAQALDMAADRTDARAGGCASRSRRSPTPSSAVRSSPASSRPTPASNWT